MLYLIHDVKAPLEPALSFLSFRAVGSLTFCSLRRCVAASTSMSWLSQLRASGKPQRRHPKTSQSAHTGLIAPRSDDARGP